MSSPSGCVILTFVGTNDFETDVDRVVRALADGKRPEKISSKPTDYYKIPLVTRYYTCDIQLRVYSTLSALESRPESDKPAFLGALIVQLRVVDISDELSAELLGLFKKHNAHTNVVVLDGDCNGHEKSLDSLSDFCAKNYVELIELEPSDETQASLIEFKEVGRLERLRDVIQCVEWSDVCLLPNLTNLPDHRRYLKSVIAELESEEAKLPGSGDVGPTSSSVDQEVKCISQLKEMLCEMGIGRRAVDSAFSNDFQAMIMSNLTNYLGEFDIDGTDTSDVESEATNSKNDAGGGSLDNDPVRSDTQ